MAARNIRDDESVGNRPVFYVKIIALAAALGVCAAGIRYGTFAASDSDPYGYVSAAELIANGSLRVDQRFALAMPWRDAPASFVPAAYVAASVDGFIVPGYPLGLPAVMAALVRASGEREAVFYAVPLLGALAVWCTALLGARVHRPLTGAAAAVVLATSPSFLYQVMQPVSDVPAVAWWTLSVLLALNPAVWSAFGAGAAASMAILTRPNLVPLAVVIGAFYAWQIVRAHGLNRTAAARFILFAAGVVPGCIAVAALHQYLYGSPLRSGYAPFHELYQWKHVLPNLDRYPRWLVSTQTPFICLGLGAPFLAKGRLRADHAWLLFLFAGVVLLSYVPYGVFGRDDWGYVRFLLPAYPALIVMSVAVSIELTRRINARKTFVVLACACYVTFLAIWQAKEATHRGTLFLREIERRYVEVGRYLATMPRESIFIAGEHAGSIRYYARSVTVNYNRLQFRSLDQAVAALTAAGRRPYIVVEEREESEFRWRFGANNALGRLDWPPTARTYRGIGVSIYDPMERARYLAGQPVVTFDIGQRERPVVSEMGSAHADRQR